MKIRVGCMVFGLLSAGVATGEVPTRSEVQLQLQRALESQAYLPPEPPQLPSPTSNPDRVIHPSSAFGQKAYERAMQAAQEKNRGAVVRAVQRQHAESSNAVSRGKKVGKKPFPPRNGKKPK